MLLQELLQANSAWLMAGGRPGPGRESPPPVQAFHVVRNRVSALQTHEGVAQLARFPHTHTESMCTRLCFHAARNAAHRAPGASTLANSLKIGLPWPATPRIKHLNLGCQKHKWCLSCLRYSCLSCVLYCLLLTCCPGLGRHHFQYQRSKRDFPRFLVEPA